jgi:hypothetical protein
MEMPGNDTVTWDDTQECDAHDSRFSPISQMCASPLSEWRYGHRDLIWSSLVRLEFEQLKTREIQPRFESEHKPESAGRELLTDAHLQLSVGRGGSFTRTSAGVVGGRRRRQRP